MTCCEEIKCIPTVRSVSIVRVLLNCLCTPLSQLPRLGEYTREILVFYLDHRVFKLLINGWGGGGGMVKLISCFISTSFSSFSRSSLRARGEDHAWSEKVGFIKISHIGQIVTKRRPNWPPLDCGLILLFDAHSCPISYRRYPLGPQIKATDHIFTLHDLKESYGNDITASRV